MATCYYVWNAYAGVYAFLIARRHGFHKCFCRLNESKRLDYKYLKFRYILIWCCRLHALGKYVVRSKYIHHFTACVLLNLIYATDDLLG